MARFVDIGFAIALVACGGPQPAPPANTTEPKPDAGPSATAGAPRTVPGPSFTSGLSAESIRRVVMAHIGGIRACYDRENDPSLKGSVTARWSIAATGVVEDADIANSTLANANAETCIVSEIRSWQFPSADAPTRVAGFPFRFGLNAEKR